ncbi:MAG: AAA family ATPase [Thermoguttaceae bacterium]
MYQAHWGLSDSPFTTRLDPRFFYQSPTHEEALARLHFLVDQERRLGLLLGDEGSGKSFLLEVFATEMRKAGHVVANLSLLGVQSLEFLWLLANEFHLNLAPDRPLPLVWRMVCDRLTEYRYEHLKVVVLLDDVDRACPEVLTQVARLAQVESSPDSQVTIVLTGRPSQVGRLGDSLLERAELRIDLDPWQPDDTEDFLKTLLAQAGRKDPVFAPSAVARLHELTQGVPRRVSQLADLALLAGAGHNLDQIDADTIESVYHELGVVQV